MSQVTATQLSEARQIADVATVQSRYNITDRSAQDVLDICVRDGIGFIPWAPIAQGGLHHAQGPLARIAHEHGATVGQIAIAWLLATSNMILPIPGTSQRTHLEQNLAAAQVTLTAQDMTVLSAQQVPSR